MRESLRQVLPHADVTRNGVISSRVRSVNARGVDPNKSFPHDSGEGVTDAVSHDIEQTIFSEINVELLLSVQTVTDEGCYLGENCLYFMLS